MVLLETLDIQLILSLYLSLNVSGLMHTKT